MKHFFDMDGTLVGYDRWVYQTDGTYPWWDNIKDQHYYLDLPCYQHMFHYIKDLLRVSPEDVYILTSVGVTKEAVYYEHVLDKIRWIQKQLPNFPMGHFLVVRTRQPIHGKQTKALLAAETLERPLTGDDILYDDFNENLLDWKDAGGRPVKVLNGINTKRADMVCLDAGPLEKPKRRYDWVRCEHNCHLCKSEWLGRCLGPMYGKDISLDDQSICSAYVYGGNLKHQYEIEYAKYIGVNALPKEALERQTAVYLWQKLIDIPMNPETETLEQPYLHFSQGTHREEIWHWLEETFPIRVYDLMYPGADT